MYDDLIERKGTYYQLYTEHLSWNNSIIFSFNAIKTGALSPPLFLLIYTPPATQAVYQVFHS
jgi:hypothetical protein